jgi:hypothetical protein
LTANELLALLGRAWPRLLIYPGGLAAFALVWLIARAQNKEQRTIQPTTPSAGLRAGDDRRPTADASSKTQTDSQFSILHSQFFILNSWLDLSAIVLPWLGLALLPLPHAAAIGRQTDLIAGLALLEWPLLLTLAAELRGCGSEASRRVRSRLAATLNGYPPLILATLVLVSAAGSFDLAALARAPEGATPARAALLHWLGATAWLLALPPALGIGAFATPRPIAYALRIGLGLRALGLVTIAALPWFALVATSDEHAPVTADARWLLLPLPPLAIAGLLWGFARLTAGRSARRWARAYLAFDAALLLVLLWAAYTALRARLA